MFSRFKECQGTYMSILNNTNLQVKSLHRVVKVIRSGILKILKMIRRTSED